MLGWEKGEWSQKGREKTHQKERGVIHSVAGQSTLSVTLSTRFPGSRNSQTNMLGWTLFSYARKIKFRYNSACCKAFLSRPNTPDLHFPFLHRAVLFLQRESLTYFERVPHLWLCPDLTLSLFPAQLSEERGLSYLKIISLSTGMSFQEPCLQHRLFCLASISI